MIRLRSLFLLFVVFVSRLFISGLQAQPCNGVVVDGGLPASISSCQSTGQITLEAAAGLNYLWSTGATTQSIVVTMSGQYYLSVTNANNCHGTDSILVSLIPESISQSDTDVCHGLPIILTTPVQAPNSNAISFNGTSSYLTIPSQGLSSGSSARAFEFWILKGTSTANSWIFHYGNTGSNHDFGCYFTPANQLYLHIDNTDYLLDNSFPAGTWEHIVVAIDNDQKYQYFKNGAFILTNNITGGITTVLNDSIWLGRNSSTVSPGWFQGSIDEFRVWNRNLGSTEIVNNMYRSLPNSFDAFLKRAYSFSLTTSNFIYSLNNIPATNNGAFFTTGAFSIPFSNFLFYSSYGLNVTQLAIFEPASSEMIYHSLNDGVNTCIDSIYMNVVPLPALPLQEVGCNTNSITLDAGSGYESYHWNNGATTQTINALVNGNYFVTVTKSQCTYTDSVNVVFATISITEPDTTICYGQPITLHAVATGGSVLWSNGATGLSQTISPLSNTTLVAYVNAGIELCYEIIIITVIPQVNVGLPDVQTWCNTSGIGLVVPYVFPTYQWSNGQTTQWINVSQTGMYKVTVTSTLGCVGKDSTQMNIHSFNLIPNDTLVCDGLPVTVMMQTSIPAQNLIWSNGNTGLSMSFLPVSTSIISVSTNLTGNQNCADEVHFTVGNRPESNLPPMLSSCHSGLQSLDVVPQSGVQYLWNNGATTAHIEVSASGWYIVTLTDPVGCIETDSSHVSIFEIFVNPIDTTVCEGQQVVISANGPTSYDYTWNSGQQTQVIFVNPLATALYEVSATDGFSTCTYQSFVHVTDVPTGSIQGPLEVEPNSTWTYSVNDHPGSTYLWFVSGGAYTPGTGSSLVINWGIEGFGFIEVTELMDNGCEGLPENLTVLIGEPDGIAAPDFNHPRVYPNPFFSDVIIESANPLNTIRIYNLLGKEVYSGTFAVNHQMLNLSFLPVGTYLLKMEYLSRPVAISLVKTE